jgi:hypothetical protein
MSSPAPSRRAPSRRRLGARPRAPRLGAELARRPPAARRPQGGDPYVMILFDTSGSMNWATRPATPPIAPPNRCTHDCPAPNCPQPRTATTPTRRSTRRSQALYEVILEARNLRLGVRQPQPGQARRLGQALALRGHQRHARPRRLDARVPGRRLAGGLRPAHRRQRRERLRHQLRPQEPHLRRQQLLPLRNRLLHEPQDAVTR